MGSPWCLYGSISYQVATVRSHCGFLEIELRETVDLRRFYRDR